MGGIEFYPQKEFDEDMEDKSDNDKIRVSSSFLLRLLGRAVLSFFHHQSFCGYCGMFFSAWFMFNPCAAPFRVEPLTSFCTQEAMPFAVVGSDKEYQVNGKRVLGRKTPWGIVEGV